MAETLVSSEGWEKEPVDLETTRSRLRELSEMRVGALSSSKDLPYDPKKLLKDCASDFQIFQGKVKQIESEDPNVASLGLEDLEACMEQLKKEIHSVEEENLRISGEIETLTRTIARDSVQLDGDLEAVACSLKYLDSQFHLPDGRGDTYESSTCIFQDDKFEILELDQRNEKSKFNFSVLQDLDDALKRVEAIGQIEYMISGVKVIEFEGNSLRLSLKTPIPTSDNLFLRHKLDCVREPTILDHELLIEVVDKTLEIKSVQIFPSDVFINGIIDTIKSLREFVFLTRSFLGWFVWKVQHRIVLCTLRRLLVEDANNSREFVFLTRISLGWFVRKVQHRIVLCTLRRLLVEDANNSRHSFEYSDRDETFTAHVVGGVDAFIKISQDWPISNSALKLLSIKTSDSHLEKNLSLSFICKVKELANSLDMQTRHHLVRFVDAIEELLVREMQSELHPDSPPA